MHGKNQNMKKRNLSEERGDSLDLFKKTRQTKLHLLYFSLGQGQ